MNTCIIYIVKFYITTIYMLVFQNKYTHVMMSFIYYIVDILL